MLTENVTRARKRFFGSNVNTICEERFGYNKDSLYADSVIHNRCMNTLQHNNVHGRQQIHQLLVWAILTAIPAILGQAVVAIIFSLVPLYITTAGSLILLALELWAMRLNHRGNVIGAVILFCVTVGLYGILLVVILPESLPAVTLTSVITTSIVLPYLEQKWHLFWNVSTVILATTIAVLGLYLRIIETINTEAIKPIIVLFVALATAIALLLLWQNQARLTRALQQSQQTNKELQALQASLEAQIAERTRVLQEMLQTVEKQATEERQLRETLLQQQEVILGLSVPIIPVKDQVLVIPLIGLIDEHRLQQIQQRALQAINQFNAHTLILDITGIPAIDKQVATKLIQIAQAIRLLGARTFLVGIHPEVAHSIVRAGIELHHIQPFARLQDALAGIVK